MVLAADHEPRIRHALRLFLQRTQHTVLLAGHGREAPELLAAHPEIRLVIPDPVMPLLDGFELIQRVCQQSALLILVLTTSGADTFLARPFSREELLLEP